MSKTRILVLNLFFLFFLIFLDQLFKYLIRFYGGFYLCNSGIAWGIKMPSFLFWTFWIATIFYVVFLIYKVISDIKHLNILFLSALVLILSGATGNLIDRIIFGCIIDFINLKIWPIFNLADGFIVIGAISILILQFKTRDS